MYQNSFFLTMKVKIATKLGTKYKNVKSMLEKFSLFFLFYPRKLLYNLLFSSNWQSPLIFD